MSKESDIQQGISAFFEWIPQNQPFELSIIRSHLSLEKIPVNPKRNRNQMRAVKYALSSLVQLYAITTARSPDAEMRAAMSEMWQRVYAWIQFLHLQCIVTPVYGETRRIIAIRAIPVAVVAYADARMGLRALVSTPGVIDILTKHWLEETKYMQQIELANGDPRFTGALAMLLSRRDDSCPVILTSMLQAAGGNEDLVARVAVEQLQHSLTREAGRDLMINSIHRHLCLINFMSHSTFDKLSSGLLYHGSLSSIISAMDLLASLPTRDHNDQQAIIWGIETLESQLHKSNARWRIAESLDAGLICVILRSWQCLSRIDPDACGSIITEIFDILADYLVFRSVLRSVARALKQAEQMQDEMSQWPEQPKVWLDFKAKAAARLQFKAVFDERADLRFLPGFFGCENKACMLRSDDIKFRQCSACRNDLYCSKECQVTSWPTHKASCHSWQKAFREGGNVPLSTHDRHFLHFLGSTDVFTNAHHIKAIIKQFYPSAPLSSLLLRMYYLTSPPGFKISLLSSENWGNDDEREEMEGFRHLSEKAEGQRLLVQICVRDGYSITGGPIMRTFPLIVPIPKNWLDK